MKNQTRSTFVKVLLLSVFTLGLATGCEEQSDDPSSSSPTASNKATLSSWATSNAAWAIRLDLSANLNGTPFTLVVKFSDTSETQCTGTLSGTEASGSYTVANCTVDSNTSSMSYSVGASTFQTGGAGTYVNNGSSFYWCRANNACFTYY